MPPRPEHVPVARSNRHHDPSHHDFCAALVELRAGWTQKQAPLEFDPLEWEGDILRLIPEEVWVRETSSVRRRIMATIKGHRAHDLFSNDFPSFEKIRASKSNQRLAYPYTNYKSWLHHQVVRKLVESCKGNDHDPAAVSLDDALKNLGNRYSSREWISITRGLVNHVHMLIRRTPANHEQGRILRAVLACLSSVDRAMDGEVAVYLMPLYLPTNHEFDFLCRNHQAEISQHAPHQSSTVAPLLPRSGGPLQRLLGRVQGLGAGYRAYQGDDGTAEFYLKSLLASLHETDHDDVARITWLFQHLYESLENLPPYLQLPSTRQELSELWDYSQRYRKPGNRRPCPPDFTIQYHVAE